MLSGSRKELYLFRTVDVAPTSISFTGNDFDGRGDLTIGLPTAKETNRSLNDSYLTINGTLRLEDRLAIEDDGDNFTIRNAGSSTVFRGTDTPIPTSGFQVRKPNGINLGVVPDWILSRFSSSAGLNFLTEESSNNTYTIDIAHRPSIVPDLNGNIYVLAIGKRVGAPDHRVFISKYTPSVDGGELELAVVAHTPISVAGIHAENPRTVEPSQEFFQPQISGCINDENELVFIITDRGQPSSESANPRCGFASVYVWNENFDITLLKQDIFNLLEYDNAALTKGKIILDGGCTMAYANGRYHVALGISEPIAAAVNINEIERSIYTGNSVDLFTWSTSYKGRNSLRRLSSLEFNESGYNITSIDAIQIGDNADLSLFACTTDGLILRSQDGGGSWEEIPTPATARIPLYAIKTIKGSVDTQAVIYAGGYRGFLMRSKNSGQDWKIIAAPHDFDFTSNFVTQDRVVSDVWRYDFREGRTLDDVINSALGWANRDLELPPTQNNKLEGHVTVPHLDRDIHTLVEMVVPSSEGNHTSLFIIHENGVMVLDKAEVNSEEDVIYPEGRRNDDKYQRMAPVFITRNSAVITSGCIVGSDLLLCGEFPQIERVPGLANALFGSYLVPYAPKEGYQPVPHFIRIERAHELGFHVKDWNKPYYGNGFYFSTDAGMPYDKNDIDTGVIGAITDIESVDENTAYAIDKNGLLIQWKRDVNKTPSDVLDTGSSAQIPPSRDRSTVLSNTAYDTSLVFTELFLGTQATDGSETATEIITIFLLNNKSEVYRSTDNGVSWRKFAIQPSSTVDRLQSGEYNTSQIDQRGNKLVRQIFIGDIYAPDPDSIIVGTGGSFMGFSVGQRIYPSYCPTSNNNLFLTTSNLETGHIEVWRSYSNNDVPIFEKIAPFTSGSDDGTGVPLNFPIPRRTEIENNDENIFTYIASETPYSNMVELPEGVLAIFAGVESPTNEGVIACKGLDGKKWVNGTDPTLPVPLKGIPSDGVINGDDINNSLRVVCTSQGRVFSGITIPIGGTFFYESRRWGESPYFMPIIPEKEQYIGVGDLCIIWTAIPYRYDEFTLGLNYGFGTDNLVKESPSFFCKTSKTYTDGAGTANVDFSPIQSVSLYWNRQDPDVIDLLGEGSTWDANALALIETNFPLATLSVTVPHYQGDVFPEQNDSYVQFQLSSIVDRGMFTPHTKPTDSNPSSNKNGCYIVCPDKNYIQNEFADGVNTHYLITYTTDPINILKPADVVIRKILRNDSHRIFYEGAQIDFSNVTSGISEFYVFADRFFMDGTNGKVGSSLGDLIPQSLADSDYQFGQWIRLSIPIILPAPEGYIKIGSCVIGKQNQVTYSDNGDVREGLQYSSGWTINKVSFVTEYGSINGISGVTKHGKPIYQLNLSYTEIESWESQVYRNLLSDNPRQAFILVPNPDHPTSVLYVRLVDDPTFAHDGGIHFSHGVSVRTIK